jgi:rhodanese-related sulfurtransferase
MSLPAITPQKARELIDQGAILVDIREADEHAREKIAAAHHAPLSRLDKVATGSPAPYVIFHCKSGNRTLTNASRLAGATDVDAYILEGGIDAWKKAGLPVVADKRQPIEIMRQVQIAAGSLVVAGVALGALVHPGFYGLAGFVGAGLVFAGTTGTCAMARLLAFAPWNRRPAAA